MQKIKLTANILFSGGGMQERGIINTGLYDLDVLSTSEIDKYAIIAYAAVHHNVTDEIIQEDFDSDPLNKTGNKKEFYVNYLNKKRIGYDFVKHKMPNWDRCNSKELHKYWYCCEANKNIGDIMMVEELPNADLWTYSFPCFTGETLVLTNKGYTEIKDVQVGDEVLTHNNQYCVVSNSVCTGEKEIYEIKAMAFDVLNTTSNHKFYTRKRNHFNTHKNGVAICGRKFDSPIWKECKDLSKDDYLGYAINTNSIIPCWDGWQYQTSDGRNYEKNHLQALISNKDFWWVIGRYIADGWCRTSGGVCICCGKHKKGEIEPHLEACGFNYNVDEEKTVYKYHVSIKELQYFVKQFGYKAHGKFIPSFVFDMPIELCKAFLDGYWSGDGCYTNNMYKASSVSRELIYGIGQLIAKVYKRPFSIYKCKRQKTVCIEGRKCNQRDSYNIVFKKTNDSQDKAFYEDGYIWFPIQSVTKTDRIEKVYDITVEQDHSFTANGCIAHNCTDISIAGSRQGIKDGLTRSGLVYEVTRLLEVAIANNTTPKYLLMENVDALVSKKFKPTFDALIQWFDEKGYNTYWQVMNAKDHGVPQNRKRVFALHIRKDIDNGKFAFPDVYDNGIRLKDILEKTVDAKYYLSKEVQERFHPIENHGDNIIGSTAPPFRTIGQRDNVYKQDGHVGSLVATDYKQPKQIMETIDG